MPKGKKQCPAEKNGEDQTNHIADLSTDPALVDAISSSSDVHLDTVRGLTVSVASDGNELQASGSATDVVLEEMCYSENLEDVGIPKEEREKSVVKESETQMNHGRPVYDFPNLWPKISREVLLFDDNEANLMIPESSTDAAESAEKEDENASTRRKPILQVKPVSQINSIPQNATFLRSFTPGLTDKEMQVHGYAIKKCDIESNRGQQSKNILLQKALEQKEDEIICKAPHFESSSQNTDKHTPSAIAEVLTPGLQIKSEIVNSPASTSKLNPLKMKTKVLNNKNKCGVCSVRLGICAIRCRCGNLYCGKHRYDRDHNCTFDYKAMGAEEIRKNNPQVIAEKIRKL